MKANGFVINNHSEILHPLVFMCKKIKGELFIQSYTWLNDEKQNAIIVNINQSIKQLKINNNNVIMLSRKEKYKVHVDNETKSIFF